MTTLRVDVGRHSSTTVQDVVDGLRLAGCMKYVELDPDAPAFLPVDELEAALTREGFHVARVPWPPPPPPTVWKRARSWPRRIYYWGRRVFLRETETDQLVGALMEAYTRDGDLVSALTMKESPLLRKLREETERQDTEREDFIFRGPRGRSGPS